MRASHLNWALEHFKRGRSLKYWFGLEASDVIAISAAVIALASVVVAVWQVKLSKRHNVLSVKPQVYVSGYFVRGTDIYLALGNFGVGPAMIKSVTLRSKDLDVVRSIKNYSDYKNIFLDFGFNLSDFDHKAMSFDVDIPVGCGKELKFLELHYHQEQYDLFVEVASFLSSLEIEVIYECIYQNNYSAFLPAAKML
ncbi:hypothetical protein [Vibrio harveyi]|uniref:hypothetical protein n=1 Tax=Vibrio harveyi TaxID=669 RepID=UPI0011AF40E0|nr:hypothetical protein [Vibrio harveyi]